MYKFLFISLFLATVEAHADSYILVDKTNDNVVGWSVTGLKPQTTSQVCVKIKQDRMEKRLAHCQYKSGKLIYSDISRNQKQIYLNELINLHTLLNNVRTIKQTNFNADTNKMILDKESELLKLIEDKQIQLNQVTQ